MILSQADSNVNCGKPYIAAQAIEYSAQRRVLLGHAGQLAVARVVCVGPDQQKHTYAVNPQGIIVEQNSGADTKENRRNGHGIGRNTELAKQHSPCKAHRPVECKVNVLFGVHRL